MGEARRRGSFEERKAQAIAAGRVKGQKTFKQKSSEALNHLGALLTLESLMSVVRAKQKARLKGR